MSEKDQVLFIDSSAPSAPSVQPSDPQSAFNEETGEINWVLLHSKSRTVPVLDQ